MEILKNEKRLLSPNKIVLPIGTEENGILDEYIQTSDKNCLEIFTCSICSCLAWDPICCPECDKPYCRSCINNYGKNKHCTYGCSNDGYREITRNEKNFLDKIKIKCTNVGCSKYIQYSDYVKHLEECNLRKYHCKNQPCKEEGYINEMINHSKICPFRLIECSKCKQNIKYCDIKSHKLEKCPEIMTKCTLCGTTMKRSIYLKEHKSENNENVKCLKLQVERWQKNYNDDINNKNKEINELKNTMKQMEIKEKEDQCEINKLKKMLNDIKTFYKNGFNRFFQDENVDRSNFRNSLDIKHEISKKIESEKYDRDFIIIDSNVYDKRKTKYNDYINRTEIKKGINIHKYRKSSLANEDINS